MSPGRAVPGAGPGPGAGGTARRLNGAGSGTARGLCRVCHEAGVSLHAGGAGSDPTIGARRRVRSDKITRPQLCRLLTTIMMALVADSGTGSRLVQHGHGPVSLLSVGFHLIAENFTPTARGLCRQSYTASAVSLPVGVPRCRAVTCTHCFSLNFI